MITLDKFEILTGHRPNDYSWEKLKIRLEQLRDENPDDTEDYIVTLFVRENDAFYSSRELMLHHGFIDFYKSNIDALNYMDTHLPPAINYGCMELLGYLHGIEAARKWAREERKTTTHTGGATSTASD